MIIEALPDIPRWLTALAEWGACLVYAALLVPRPSTVWRGASMVGMALATGVALWATQNLAELLPLPFWIVGMAAAVAVMFVFLRISLGEGPTGTIFLTARAFVLAELVASLHWQLRTFFFSDAQGVNLVAEAALILAVYGGGFTIAARAEKRHFPRGKLGEVRAGELTVSIGIAVGTFTVSNLSFAGVASPFTGRVGPEIFTIRTLVDLCGYVALYAQQEQRREHESRAESAAVRSLLRTQHEQYLQSRRTLDEVDRKVHDMRHWIAVIRSEPDEVRRSQFLDELQDRVTEDAVQRRTGSAVVDAILAAKAQACVAHRIQLTVVADGTLLDSLNVVDTTSILGNALDNAIEGAARVSHPERRHIKIALYAKRSFIMLRIENTFDGHMRLEAGRPVTRKAETSGHGYGLRSIERVAEAYGGAATFEAGDEWFILRVLLPSVDSQREPSTE